MPVYKDKRRNTWYAKCNYTDALGNHKSARSRDFETKKTQDELAKIKKAYSFVTECLFDIK